MKIITFLLLFISSALCLKSQNTEFGVHWGNAVYGTPPIDFTSTNNALQPNGVKYIRCSFSWNTIEPSLNTFNWYSISAKVDSLLSRGFNIIGLLSKTPSWYTTNNTGNPQYDTYFAPQDTIEWGKFVDSVVTKFQGRIKYWEIWNEPNDVFLTTVPNNYIAKAQALHNLLKSAYHRIKAADPVNKVLVGGFTSHICYSQNNLLFLNQFFINQSYNYFDIMNFHVYDFPYTIRDTLLPKMQAHGIGNMPIWITETNQWRILAANGGNSLTNTANYLCTWINDTLINYFNPEVICWFNVRNWATYLPGVCDNCVPDSTAYGLLDSSFVPTIVLGAYSNCISSITGIEAQQDKSTSD